MGFPSSQHICGPRVEISVTLSMHCLHMMPQKLLQKKTLQTQFLRNMSPF